MSVSLLQLGSALRALGKAVPLVGTYPAYQTAGQLTALAMTEGPVTLSGLGGAEINALTAREHTGGLVHQAKALPGAITVNLPILPGDPLLWAKISPYGTDDGIPDNAPPVAEKTLWLVPESAWAGITTIGYDGATWTPADSPTRIENAILFGRGFFTFDDVTYQFDEGGKAPLSVHFTPMYDSLFPTNKKAWIRGNPVAKGLTSFRA